MIAPSKRIVGKVERGRVADLEADVLHPRRGGLGARLLDHRRGQVDPGTEPTRGAIARAISPGPQATSTQRARRVLGDQVDHHVERLGQAHRRAAGEGLRLVGELVADRELWASAASLIDPY